MDLHQEKKITQQVSAPLHMNFGILGAGRYGKKILSKLRNMGNVIWVENSDSDYTELKIPEWVFIATPNIFHYEQAEYFLKSGANVFVEKPAVINPSALDYLVNLSKKVGKLLYISDVFLYHGGLDKKNQTTFLNQFIWHKKSSGERGALLDRLAYHHMYLIFEALGGGSSLRITSCAKFEPNRMEFEASLDDQRLSFSYKVSETVENIHKVFSKEIDVSADDALSNMLSAVLSQRVSFEKNQMRAIWATTQIFEIKKQFSKKIGIVGGGIFGSTVAVELANQGYNVVLYERHENLLEEASSINQYRVHRGYHYPRSYSTALECKVSSRDFIKNYRQSIVKKTTGLKHYYAIASSESMTDIGQYIDFMDAVGLEYKKVKRLQGTDMTIEVQENIFDPSILRSMVKKRLEATGVELRLKTNAEENDLKNYDFTVIATYSRLNDWRIDKREYQYELCEKPVLRLPDGWRMKSVVVMDGPFMSVDPLGDSGLHVMGNVVHAIHHSNVGYEPVIPDGYKKLLNKGIVKNPKITKIDNFIQSASQFFPDIIKAEHVGSMFTIRTVLPNREKDDARPTLVEWISGNRLAVFSGKICTCVSAARKVVTYIEDRFCSGNSD